MCTEGVSDPTGQAMKADFEKRLFCVGKMREELKRSKIGALIRALALVDFFRQPTEKGLDDLDQHDKDDHRDPHDGGDAPLMAVADGDVTQSAAAHGAGHGGIGQNGDNGNGTTQHKGGLGFRQIDLPDDLERGGTHGLRGLHHAGFHLRQGGFHHAGDKGSGRNNQGNDGALHADLRADDELGKGHDGHHQNDKGKRAAHIDDPAENLVDSPIGPDAVGLGDGENHAQRQADEIRKDGGNAGHDQRIPCAFQKIAAVFSPEHGNGIKHGIPPPQR